MSGYACAVRGDSLSPDGVRLTTLEVTFPRYVLAEVNTHRVFSRNSASSRAIPVAKRIAAVRENPFVPPFGKNQRGMQAGEDLGDEDAQTAELIWRHAALKAAEYAEQLAELEVHKQVANRLLEPFVWHEAILTSTAWENFLNQRDPVRSPLADPAIQPAARLIAEALESSEPIELAPGEFHLPYIRPEDHEEAHAWAMIRTDLTGVDVDPQEILRRVSTARCARVSYLTHDGRRDMSKDLQLYRDLVSARPMHASPLEHVAKPCSCDEYLAFRIAGENPGNPDDPFVSTKGITLRPDHRGNFAGFDQLRHTVEFERGLDSAA